MSTQAVEDYLKAIFDLQSETGRVTTSALAERLRVSPASVTGMVKKLAEMKLVTHRPYQGVHTTTAGKRIALRVLRRHRLVELYLFEVLGIPWDRVHQEAEKWEHVISEEIAERFDELLGSPTHDPHGAPIPTRDGEVIEVLSVRLSDLNAGQSTRISQVADANAEFLRYLGERGLYPGTTVEVLAVEPMSGPLTVRVGDQQHILGRQVAEAIAVAPIESSEEKLR